MTIGERVGRAIDQSGLTQREVARRARMDPATLNAIVQGSTKDPKFITIERIVRAIGISFSTFYDEPRIQLSTDDAELGRRFHSLLGRLLATDAEQKVVVPQPPVRDTVIKDAPPLSEVEPMPNEPIPDKYVRVRANRAFEVRTDAMSAIGILQGAMIYARASVDVAAADGEIVVAKLNGVLYLKRLDLRAGRTALHSENRKYEDILVDDDVDTFSIVAVVYWP